MPPLRGKCATESNHGYGVAEGRRGRVFLTRSQHAKQPTTHPTPSCPSCPSMQFPFDSRNIRAKIETEFKKSSPRRRVRTPTIPTQPKPGISATKWRRPASEEKGQMTQRPGPLETNAATRSSRVARSRRRNTSQQAKPTLRSHTGTQMSRRATVPFAKRKGTRASEATLAGDARPRSGRTFVNPEDV